MNVAHVTATIGTTNYAVSIAARHHHLTADEGAKLGGQDAGPAPYDLLCASLAACTAITLRMYAERKQWTLRGVKVDARYTAAEGESSISRKLGLDGDLTTEQRERLADIAERTPVTLTLKRGVTITTTLEP